MKVQILGERLLAEAGTDARPPTLTRLRDAMEEATDMPRAERNNISAVGCQAGCEEDNWVGSKEGVQNEA